MQVISVVMTLLMELKRNLVKLVFNCEIFIHVHGNLSTAQRTRMKQGKGTRFTGTRIIETIKIISLL